MSSKNAAKWCVTWPFFELGLENPQFGHFFRNFIRTSGSKICWSPNKYFSNQCKKCFNLRYILNHLPLIFFFHIMTIRDVKQFLVVSRDSSIDKQYKWSCWIGFSTLSDKRLQMRNFNQNSPKKLTFLLFFTTYASGSWIEYTRQSASCNTWYKSNHDVIILLNWEYTI